MELVMRPARRVKTDLEMVCHDVEKDYTSWQLMLRQDLAANKLRWYGVWASDLWCFLRNTNPVVSICFSHKLHPISRTNRWCAMGLQVIFLLLVCALLMEARLCIACDFVHCSDRVYSAADCGGELQNRSVFAYARNDPFAPLHPEREVELMHQKQRNLNFFRKLNFCCSAQRVGVVRFFFMFGIYGGFVYSVLANCVFSLSVFPLMMCACVQRSSPRFRTIGIWCGYCLVATLAVVLCSLVPFLLEYTWKNSMLDEFAVMFLIGKIGSWSCVTLLNIVVFSVMWALQGGRLDMAALPSDGGGAPVRPGGSPSSGGGGGGKPEGRNFHITAEEYAWWAQTLEDKESTDRT